MSIPGTTTTERVYLYPDTYAGRHQALIDHTITPLHHSLANNRSCDGTRQICGSVLFGVCCLLCACTRLWRNCTGYDPVRVECCDQQTIPGLEICATAGCDVCAERGYGHNEYAFGQEGGRGLSRRTLDIVNVSISPIEIVFIGICLAASA